MVHHPLGQHARVRPAAFVACLIAALTSHAMTVAAQSLEREIVVARPFDPDPVPLPHAVADCPGDLVLACDHPANPARRQNWLDAFGGDPAVGCGFAYTSLQISPGALISSVSYDNFTDVSSLTLNNATAVIRNPVLSNGRNVLRLTDNLGQAGSAFVTNAVTLDLNASFSAFFSFQIASPIGTSDNDGVGADGLVFVVQTVANTAGGLGGGIGYEGIARSFGIEMDTWNNGGWDDNDGNHVGINIGGAIDSVVQAPISPRMNDGATWFTWVDYNGVTDELEVRLTTAPVRPVAPLITHVVDLVAVLGAPDAFIGFTSGTGSAGGFHDILSFYFENSRSPTGCGVGGAETVVSTVIDECGNTASCTNVLTMTDNDAPVLTAGSISGCFASAAEAEAAVIAATTITETCSPPVTITTAVAGTCDTIVRLTAIDSCLNAAFIDQSVTIAPLPLGLVPSDVRLACGGLVGVVAGAGDIGFARPSVVVVGGCGPHAITNDRTGGGADGSDWYPCGLTVVIFEAVDSCGLTASCRLGVRVEPPALLDVGAALRVTKDAPGASRAPVLDWSRAAVGAGPSFAVLRSIGDPTSFVFATTRAPGTTWTDARAQPRFICYDVRSIDCDAAISLD